ncbi:MAG: hypothetical protein ABSD59_18105 [Terracidiphilus sp.]|jgi:hypothetical protein
MARAGRIGVLSSGSYIFSATTLSSVSATITIPAGSPAADRETLTPWYTPDSASSANYNSATGIGSVQVTLGSSTGLTRVAVTFNIDVLANRRTISQFVYDGNIGGSQKVADLSLPLGCWGGNGNPDQGRMDCCRHPAATLTPSGNNQLRIAGTALSQPLTVTLTLG